MKSLKNISIYKYLINNKKVNLYTKMILVLNSLCFYDDYYIPNKKLMNILKIDKKSCIRILQQLESDRVITISYIGRKRFFNMRLLELKNKEDLSDKDYNWLLDYEEE